MERERVQRCMGTGLLCRKLVHAEAEEDQFEGSFADEEEEEKLFNLAGTQLNEALVSERNATRTVA